MSLLVTHVTPLCYFSCSVTERTEFALFYLKLHTIFSLMFIFDMCLNDFNTVCSPVKLSLQNCSFGLTNVSIYTNVTDLHRILTSDQ